jgi:hypothetical protein
MGINSRVGHTGRPTGYDELGHWWAYNYGNKTVRSMRAAYNFMFSYESIIAQMFDGKEKDDSPIVLIIGGKHTQTTNKHITSTKISCGHMRAIHVQNIDPKNVKDHRANVKWIHDQVIELSVSLGKRTAERGKDSDAREIRSLIYNATVYAERFGMLKTPLYKFLIALPDPRNPEFLKIVNVKSAKIANEWKRIAKEKRLEGMQAILKLKQVAEEKYESWSNGGNTRPNEKYLGGTRLRIIGNTIETTGGASIPVTIAIRAYKKYIGKSILKGDKIGPFEYIGELNGVVTIGCHRIDIEVIHELLKGLEIADFKESNKEKSFDELNTETQGLSDLSGIFGGRDGV